VWNRFDHRRSRAVVSLTPFNFTAIAGNLPSGAGADGHTVIWKPSPDPAVRAHFTNAALRGGRSAAA